MKKNTIGLVVMILVGIGMVGFLNYCKYVIGGSEGLALAATFAFLCVPVMFITMIGYFLFGFIKDQLG